jgi:hypothetical protein
LTNLERVATSETGEFALLLPPRLQTGDPMEISMGEEWVVVSPFEGYGFIPPSFTEVIVWPAEVIRGGSLIRSW